MMHIVKKLVSLLVVVAFAVLAFPGSVFASEAQEQSGKVINVVYDDSGSMVTTGGQIIPRWSQAKYAMEVFCAMMGESDVMHIYPMSMEGGLGLTLYGNDGGRVQAVHDMNAYYNNTPFITVTSAANDLRNESSEYDKWLVIITDGAFDDGATPVSTVQSTIDGYNAEGIKTIYLGIGDNASEIQGNENGGYATKAADGLDVLYKVTSIANQIFDLQVLPDANISAGDTQTLLNVDIPISQIIVFAQGDAVEIGNLTLNGQTIEATSIQNVKYSDVLPLNYSNAVVDTSLKGVVATFDAGATPFESGQFSIPVLGASTVSYYYKPGVTVHCGLLYNGSEVQADDELYAGDYEVEMSFINPITGYVVESDLLSSTAFTLSVLNNGTEQVITEKEGTISLTEGDVEINSTAALPGNVYLRNNNKYVVFPEPLNLSINTTTSVDSYSPDALGANAAPIIISVERDNEGTPLSEEEWNSTEITVEEAGGVTWQVSKGSYIGTWELRPVSSDGTISGVQSGEHTNAISAAFQIGNQYAYGTGNIECTFEEYAGNDLQIEFVQPIGNYDLNDMDAPKPVDIVVRYENPETGEYLDLTDELWDNLSINASSEKHVSWSIVKEAVPGKCSITPAYYLGDPLATAKGQVDLIVEAEGSAGEYRYSGSATQQLEFAKLSWLNLLKILGPRIAIAAFVIWLVIGYIKKKRLRTRNLNPRCRYKDAASPKQKISKSFFSVVLPYVSEKAIVSCHKPVFQCNFPDLQIQAAGKRSFRIINKSFPIKTTKICGEFFEDMDTLKKKRFSFSSFDLTSVNPKNNRSLGTFTFK